MRFRFDRKVSSKLGTNGKEMDVLCLSLSLCSRVGILCKCVSVLRVGATNVGIHPPRNFTTVRAHTIGRGSQPHPGPSRVAWHHNRVSHTNPRTSQPAGIGSKRGGRGSRRTFTTLPIGHLHNRSLLRGWIPWTASSERVHNRAPDTLHNPSLHHESVSETRDPSHASPIPSLRIHANILSERTCASDQRRWRVRVLDGIREKQQENEHLESLLVSKKRGWTFVPRSFDSRTQRMKLQHAARPSE